MTSTTRSALIGATLGVVLVAGVVGSLVLRGGVKIDGESTTPSTVVVVFAMPGEDRAVTAQLVAVVDAASGRYKVADASSTVSIPGTSYTLLRDSYPFGGAKAVAAALGGGSIARRTAWVDISPEAWARILAAGVDVTLTQSFDTFDEASDHYSEFVDGPQHVATADLWGLVNGAGYADADDRRAITDALARTSLRALRSLLPGKGVTTDMTTEQWSRFVSRIQVE